MMKTSTIKNIHIEGRRYHNSNCNTYYSSTLSVNGEVKETINNEYGYGSSFETDIINKFINNNAKSEKAKQNLKQKLFWSGKVHISSNVADCKRKEMVNFAL